MKDEMNWISVKDRLPEHDNDVLVYLNNSCAVGFYSQDNKKWFRDRCTCSDCYLELDATHWMPLPEEPK